MRIIRRITARRNVLREIVTDIARRESVRKNFRLGCEKTMRHDRAFLTERIWQLKGEGLTGCAIARALHCPKTFVHKILNEGRLDLPRALAVTLRQTAHARGMTAQSLAEMVLRDGLASLTNAPATRVAPALREAA